MQCSFNRFLAYFRTLPPLGVLSCGLLLTILLLFHVLDYDVWWHIKAGQLMRETWSIPATDPFAYTREGQPYLASHGWLAQLFLSLIYDVGGVNALIVFRMAVVLGLVMILLSADSSRLWPNVLLAVPAVEMARPAFMDRPQLFTFLLLAVTLRLAIAYVECHDHRRRSIILLTMIGIEVLWVNLHGAACLLGLVIAGSLGVQRLFDTWQTSRLTTAQDQKEITLLLLTGVGMLAALCASPNGWHNLTYIYELLTDNTIQFIQEWQPRPWGPYLRATGLWWVLGVFTILRARRAPVFSSMVLMLFGWLSTQAFRHEAPFILVVLGIVVLQLKHDAGWHALLHRLAARRTLAFAVGAIALVALSLFVRSSVMAFTQRHQTFGFGAFTPARGAEVFLRTERLNGRMFNSYDIGGYLLFRGSPERTVFIDGRNVDFGYDLMERTTRAAQDVDAWGSLQDEYSFTVAVIHYEPYTDISPLPYAGHLRDNPEWTLVYIDDWTAVYLRDVPENHDTLERLRYRFVTPEGLSHQTLPEGLTLETVTVLERELVRAAESDASSINALLLLAQLYRRAEFFEDAQMAIDTAADRQPANYRAYEARAMLAIEQEDWDAAADAFSAMLDRAGSIAEAIRYDVIADVFTKAGRPISAWWYGMGGR